jgi:hypothetical protein
MKFRKTFPGVQVSNKNAIRKPDNKERPTDVLTYKKSKLQQKKTWMK